MNILVRNSSSVLCNELRSGRQWTKSSVFRCEASLPTCSALQYKCVNKRTTLRFWRNHGSIMHATSMGTTRASVLTEQRHEVHRDESQRWQASPASFHRASCFIPTPYADAEAQHDACAQKVARQGKRNTPKPRQTHFASFCCKSVMLSVCSSVLRLVDTIIGTVL